MSEFNNRELIEAIYDVRDRVTRIEEKLNRTEGLSDKVEDADDKATEALLLAKKNEANIDRLREKHDRDMETTKSNSRWAWGFVITLATLLIVEYFKSQS